MTEQSTLKTTVSYHGEELTAIVEEINWNLVEAFRATPNGEPPRYVEPHLQEDVFTPRISLDLQTRISNQTEAGHAAWLRTIDQHNEPYRYVYIRGLNKWGREHRYFKVAAPGDDLQRGAPSAIHVRRKDFFRDLALANAVGPFERIIRAIPYGNLRRSLEGSLKERGLTPPTLSFVGLDRRGLLPAEILSRAWGAEGAHLVKYEYENIEALRAAFAKLVQTADLQGTHVVFVDMTIPAMTKVGLTKIMEGPRPFGCTGWTVAGGSPYDVTSPNECKLSWGVETRGVFCGQTMLLEPGSDEHKRMLSRMFSVMDGYIYGSTDIDEQLLWQYRDWQKNQEWRKSLQEAEERQQRIAARKSKRG